MQTGCEIAKAVPYDTKNGTIWKKLEKKESDSCGFVKNVEMQGEGDRVLENL